MLFSDIQRTFEGPKPHAEPEYDYLDRSARPHATSIRSVLTEWFTHYPESDRADLVGRFKSRTHLQHTAAAYELYLHELFRRLGYVIEVHPETPSDKGTRPDFLLKDSTGAKTYVEAVQPTDVSTDKRGAQARLDVVYDSINGLEVYEWFIGVHARTDPNVPPSGKKLKRELKRWLDGLDPDEVTEQVERSGSEACPKLGYRDKDWRIQFTAFPRSLTKRDQPVGEVVGAIVGAGGWLSTWQTVRDALLAKASRYGRLDAPFVIAVNANVVDLDDIDVMEALFGKEQFIVDPHQPERQPTMERSLNGFWRGPSGPRYTRVGGVLIGSDAKPWTYGVRSLTLYENPWAKAKVKGAITALPRKVARNGQMEAVSGLHPRDVLQLPASYPGVSETAQPAT